MYICICIYIYYIYMCIYIYTYAYVYIYIYMYIHICVYKYIYVFVVYMCIQVYTCVINMFLIFTYVYTHTDSQYTRSNPTRLKTVKTLLTTIHQFSTLENAGVDELEVMYAKFLHALDYLKARPYSILDFVESGTGFDEDFVDFTSKITTIEIAMRDFISESFEELQNIEIALDLLTKLEVILQRDSLKV